MTVIEARGGRPLRDTDDALVLPGADGVEHCSKGAKDRGLIQLKLDCERCRHVGQGLLDAQDDFVSEAQARLLRDVRRDP